MFEVFSKNLEIYIPELANCFICPICIRIATRETLNENLLSEAHLYPKAIKSGEATIICKECNDKAGHSIECHETKRVKRRRALVDPTESFETITYVEEDGKLHPVTTRTSVDFSQSPPQLKLEVIESRSNPIHADKITAILSQLVEGRPDFKFHLSEKHDWDNRKADLTYLQSAYLALFNRLGYEFVFSQIAEDIRKQLMDPNSSQLQVHMVQSTGFHSMKDLDVLVITKPKSHMGFIVKMPEPDASMRNVVVWIPWLTETYPHELQFPDLREVLAHRITLTHCMLCLPENRGAISKHVMGSYNQKFVVTPVEEK